MGKRLFYWELAGALFTAAMGTLLHFVYDWSGGWGAAAAFSAVNESTWEHMKLLFFPMFLFSVVQVCCLGRNYPNFLAARGVSTVTGVALIPVLFYTYTGVLGRHLLWADIAVFYLSVLGAFALDFRLLRRGRFTSLLLEKDVNEFAATLKDLYEPADTLPRYYKEALAIYADRYQTDDLAGKVDSLLITRYQDYKEKKKQFTSPTEERNRMRREYGDTYWWYFDYQH